MITHVMSLVKLPGHLSNPNQLLLIVRVMYGWDLIRCLDDKNAYLMKLAYSLTPTGIVRLPESSWVPPQPRN